MNTTTTTLDGARAVLLPFIRREGIEITACVILTVKTLHTDAESTVQSIRCAVTQWVRASPIGVAVHTYAANDLNIGDLLSHDAFQDPSLRDSLRAHGVEVLEASFGEFDAAIPFDRVLVEPVERAEVCA